MTQISRRAALRSLAASLVTPAILRGNRRSPGENPNLLVVWTDEQRADSMAAYGNHRFRVPAMNRLAVQSIVFDRCYDTQPVCTPARSSVLTGLWPHQNGCIDNNIMLRRETQAFPELLGDSSYRTGYYGKWHLGDEAFAQHGFEEWISIEDGYSQYFSPGRDRSKHSDYHRFLSDLGYKPDEPDGTFSRVFAVQRPLRHCKPAFLATEASDFILRHRAEPWILHVNFLEPHMPFHGPLNDLHSEEEAPVPANYPGIPVEREPEDYTRRREKHAREGVSSPSYLVLPGHDMKDRPAIQRLNRNYAGLCAQVDQALGRILWALEASGQAGNTIVVFTTDHGEMMGAHSLCGKGVFYEEAIRVPLLIQVPFRHSRQIRVDAPVSHIDLVPTLLDLMGRKKPESLPGKSLVPLIEGRERAAGDVFIEWNSVPDGPNGRAVVTPEGWKLGLYDRDDGLLFHRHKDPLEMQNLCYRREHAGLVRDLRARIESWQKQHGDRLPLRVEG